MKKVLLLTYYFPPRNRISSYRLAGFCRHLPQFGWEPTVICEDWPNHAPDYDSSLLEDLQNVNIHRINSYKPRGVERLFVRNVYPWIYPARTPYNWWKLARKKAYELCATGDFDVIVASHDPLSTLSIASEISQHFKIPWVADIRDSWNVQTLSSPRKQKMIASLEKKYCKDADRVVTVSNEISQVLEHIINKKVYVVQNGFDENIFNVPTDEKANTFIILYAGSFAKTRQNPIPLFRALNQSISLGMIPSNLIEVCFLGSPKNLFSEDELKIFGQVSVRFMDRVSRKEALMTMKSSSLLWVIPHPHEKGVLTGKIFDYLATGRPIVAIPDDFGEINRLLRETKAGFSISKQEEILEKIYYLFTCWKKDKRFTLNYNTKEISKHRRDEKTKQLSEVLNSLVN